MHGMVAKAEDNNSFNPRLKPACRQAGRGFQFTYTQKWVTKNAQSPCNCCISTDRVEILFVMLSTLA